MIMPKRLHYFVLYNEVNGVAVLTYLHLPLSKINLPAVDICTRIVVFVDVQYNSVNPQYSFIAQMFTYLCLSLFAVEYLRKAESVHFFRKIYEHIKPHYLC